MSHNHFGCYLRAAAGAVALLAIAAQANATTVSMASLLAGGSIVCGDKIFQHFHDFISVGDSPPTAAEIFATNIDCSTSDPGPGLLWQSGQWHVNQNESMDTSWSYDVVVNSGADLIHDASMAFLSATADPDADIHITETLFDSSNNFVDSLLIDFAAGLMTDHHVFSQGYSFLTVNKDVSLAGHTTGNASLSTFTQNFSQIPEPGTLSMMGIALGALAFASRKFSRKPRASV